MVSVPILQTTFQLSVEHLQPECGDRHNIPAMFRNDFDQKGLDERVREAGYVFVNIDAVLIAERPRIARHVEATRHNIAEDTGLPLDAINTKGTTTEKMGFTGREEGIAASAVCLIE
jgi:YgbB family